MRKIIMTVAIAMMMSSAVMAQSSNDNKEKKAFDKTEMAKKRTEDVAKKYGLDEEQTKKLLELNTKYADSLRVGMRQRGARGMAQGGRGMNQGERQQGERPQGGRPQGGNRGGERREGMSNAMKNYNEQLKAIMTTEQYEKYSADVKARPERSGEKSKK